MRLTDLAVLAAVAGGAACCSSHGQSQGLAGAGSPAKPDFNSALEAAYGSIDASKSLFVNDSRIWGDDPFFTFNNQVQAAASLANPQAPQTALQTWRDDAAAILSPTPVPKSLDLQSVVNRLDLADPANGKGPELHFVYEYQDQKNRFHLILEFLMPPAVDLAGLATAWNDLGRKTSTTPGAQLRGLIQNLHFVSARIRTNSQSGGDGDWALAEWDFIPGQPIVPGTLEDQISGECQPANGSGIPTDCSGWAAVWDQLNTVSPTQPVPYRQFPSGLFVENANPGLEYSSFQSLRPSSTQNIPSNVTTARGDVRHALAMRQCTFCHGAETGTDFQHVFIRDANSTLSKLSCFLSGKDQNTVVALPPFSNFHSNDCTVTMQFSSPSQPVHTDAGSIQACGDNLWCETRQYNELGRRGMYMAAILLKEPPAANGVSVRHADFQTFRQSSMERFAGRTTH